MAQGIRQPERYNQYSICVMQMRKPCPSSRLDPHPFSPISIALYAYFHPLSLHLKPTPLNHCLVGCQNTNPSASGEPRHRKHLRQPTLERLFGLLRTII